MPKRVARDRGKTTDCPLHRPTMADRTSVEQDLQAFLRRDEQPTTQPLSRRHELKRFETQVNGRNSQREKRSGVTGVENTGNSARGCAVGNVLSPRLKWRQLSQIPRRLPG